MCLGIGDPCDRVQSHFLSWQASHFDFVTQFQSVISWCHLSKNAMKNVVWAWKIFHLRHPDLCGCVKDGLLFHVSLPSESLFQYYYHLWIIVTLKQWIYHTRKITNTDNTSNLVSEKKHSFLSFRICKQVYDVMDTNHNNSHMIFWQLSVYFSQCQSLTLLQL